MREEEEACTGPWVEEPSLGGPHGLYGGLEVGNQGKGRSLVEAEGDSHSSGATWSRG